MDEIMSAPSTGDNDCTFKPIEVRTRAARSSFSIRFLRSTASKGGLFATRAKLLDLKKNREHSLPPIRGADGSYFLIRTLNGGWKRLQLMVGCDTYPLDDSSLPSLATAIAVFPSV